MKKRYAVLVIVNSDEVRLCFVNAYSIGEADEITHHAYSVLDAKNSIRTEIYDTAIYNDDVIDEVSISYFC